MADRFFPAMPLTPAEYEARKARRAARRATTRKWKCYSGHGKRIVRGSDEEADAESTSSSWCKRCCDTVSGYWSR